MKSTNSCFSDHIDAFEACLANDRATNGHLPIANRQLLGAMEPMMTAFVNISWARMSSWETAQQLV
ncbi:hypothetical protein AC579_9972 [Pseudocercospora musae]|uniref:Uncharacterized protein n=1 Tax=Pseudocercospora musae TaxID=113226 RepID=A0A139I4J9_9PEZI|nr:hypothetical protein AC579_9972 [Pseudocercospora musae]